MGHFVVRWRSSAGYQGTSLGSRGGPTKWAAPRLHWYIPVSYTHLLTSTDGRGNTTAYEYDAMGNLLSQTDAEGNTTTYTYDNTGNCTSVTDAKGNKSSMEMCIRDRQWAEYVKDIVYKL